MAPCNSLTIADQTLPRGDMAGSFLPGLIQTYGIDLRWSGPATGTGVLLSAPAPRQVLTEPTRWAWSPDSTTPRARLAAPNSAAALAENRVEPHDPIGDDLVVTIPARQIRARYTAETIRVYQAYSPEIALPAMAAGRLVAPVRRNRMTWIKPSYGG